jgi:hypothetical protein
MVTTEVQDLEAQDSQWRLEKERATVGSGASESPLARALKGAFAGATSVLAMDYVTWRIYLKEDREAYVQEKERAQVGAKWGAHVAAERLSGRMDRSLSRGQRFMLGRVIHYMMGAAPGMIYGLLSQRFPQIRTGRGLVYGLALFLLQDELMGPMMGMTSPPTHYPWQAHARGLVGHLALGATMDAAFETLNLP